MALGSLRDDQRLDDIDLVRIMGNTPGQEEACGLLVQSRRLRGVGCWADVPDVPSSVRDLRSNVLSEVTTRNRIARHLVTGVAAEFVADIWRYLATSFADTPALQ